METGKIEDDVVDLDDEHQIHTRESVDVEADNVIDIVQRTRMSQLLNGAPLDKDEMALMRDLNSDAFKQKRIVADEKTADASGELAKALGQMLVSGVTLAKDPAETTEEKVLPDLEGEVIDKFKISDELITDKQEDISLETIMKAPDLK